MNGKPWLNQLKIITRSRSFSESFHWYEKGEIPAKRGKYPVLRTNTKPHQPIKHPKISYPLVSLVFHKFLCGTRQNETVHEIIKVTVPAIC